jgi:ketosteroid isomerase-like protein
MRTIVRMLFGYLMVGILAYSTVSAEECSGTITAEEALRAEDARYAAQTTNDFGAMERMFGQDLVYIHASAAVDNKDTYIESMRSGRVKYKTMRRGETKVRTYGCLAIITGTMDLDVNVGGEDRSLQLRFHTVWVKRGQGTQFVSWQATLIPPKK